MMENDYSQLKKELLYKQLQLLAEKSKKCGLRKLLIISSMMLKIYDKLYRREVGGLTCIIILT